MGGIYPHRWEGEIQVGVYRNVWSWREMAHCDRSSGWDRHCRCFCLHRMERPPPTFSFRLPICSVFWWINLTFNSIWHQGNMTYCHFQHLFILPVTSWRVHFLLKDRYCLLCVQSSAASSVAVAAVKKPSFLLQLQSIFPSAAELQVLCGMSYLSEVLETDLFHSVLWKWPMRECLSGLKLQPWAPILQPDDWQGKWGELFR